MFLDVLRPSDTFLLILVFVFLRILLFIKQDFADFSDLMNVFTLIGGKFQNEEMELEQ